MIFNCCISFTNTWTFPEINRLSRNYAIFPKTRKSPFSRFLTFSVLKPPKQLSESGNSVSRLFVVLYNLSASFIRKFGCLVEISWKYGKTRKSPILRFLTFSVLKPSKQMSKLGNSVSRWFAMLYNLRASMMRKNNSSREIFPENKKLTISCFYCQMLGFGNYAIIHHFTPVFSNHRIGLDTYSPMNLFNNLN